MSPRPFNPETHQPIRTLSEYDRIARETAGLPGYKMDDPERPFTEQFESQVDLEPVIDDQGPITPPKSRSDYVAENIRPIMKPGEGHIDRTSEAARDQGWGPVDVPPVDKEPKKSRALTGKFALQAAYRREHAEEVDTHVPSAAEIIKMPSKSIDRMKELHEVLKTGDTSTLQTDFFEKRKPQKFPLDTPEK